MKNKLVRIKCFYFVYVLLIIITILIIIKFLFDFYKMTVETNIIEDKYIVDSENFIEKPRVQLENDGKFEYIQSRNGFLNEEEYIFNDIEMKGYFGDVKAGKLEIKDDKNIFEFTVQPNFTIYLNNIKK